MRVRELVNYVNSDEELELFELKVKVRNEDGTYSYLEADFSVDYENEEIIIEEK